MIPGGYGFEVLRFENESLREIGRLPPDVRIVGALPDLAERHGTVPREWHHGGAPLRPVYILIAHRYCVRVPAGAPYQFTELDDFVKRYGELAVQEREPLAAPCDYLRGEAWYCGEDGIAREYVYAGDRWVVR